MAYTQVGDVKGLIPYVDFTRESRPSEGTVQQWIADAETAINTALLAMGYETPITGPKSIVIIKDAIAHFVAAKVLRSRPSPDTDPEAFQRRYDAFLKALRDPNDLTITLEDATKTAGAIVKDVRVKVSSNLSDLLEEDPMRVHRNQVF